MIDHDVRQFLNPLKIFICDHIERDQGHASRHFSTLVSGAISRPDRHYLGDLDGINIATNSSFSEMRHQHHVWKFPIRHAKHVGFEHYRRAFYIDFLPSSLIHHDNDRIALRRRFARDDRDCVIRLNERNFGEFILSRSRECDDYPAQLEAWIDDCDIIIPRPWFDETIKQQWAWTHIARFWDIFVEIVNEMSSKHFDNNYCDFEIMRPSFFNMYIMRLTIFQRYMAFWTDCSERLQDRLPDEPRLLGHFSERIINIFINQISIETPALRIRKLPIVFRE